MDCNGLNEIEGIQVIPVDANKRPIPKGWQNAITKYDLSNVAGVGLVCGMPSGNVQAIDFDLKYDLTGKLIDSYKKLVHSVNDTLLAKVVVQKTRSNGFHFIFRCADISGNKKLANRETTEQEKADTYKMSYDASVLAGKDDAGAKKIAEKASKNDKVRVLIETRETGGQIVISPSIGYEFVFGDLCSISEITPEERDTLHSIARQFNTVQDEIVVPRNTGTIKTKGLSPFDDYNERADVVGFLEGHGWKVVGSKGSKTLMLRPGQTTAQHSGNYDHTKKWFSVFTTSTEFDPQKAYLPYAVFAKLECADNFSDTAKKLLDMGFGERDEPKPKEKYQSTRQIPSRVNLEDNDLSFLATENDYGEYLNKVRSGTLEMGLTTGIPSLDKHFLHKEGNLVMTNGIDNTGKSVVTWYLYLLAAMYHGWHGIIFSSENTLGAFMRKMIQFYWGKPLYGAYKMNDMEYDIAKKFIEKHFKLIKAEEDLYNYKDIMNMVRKSRVQMPYLNFGMIDPYNSLKVDLTGFSKLSTHEYHYEALSEIKAFGQKNKFGWVINNHAVTSALRTKDAEKKYPVAPRKEDTEGGGKFANKTDDFITVHRVTGHPTDWMVTEIHVRKIKDTETGGRPTAFDVPIKLEMYKNQCAFIERLEEGESRPPIDPVERWHQLSQPQQTLMELPQHLPRNWDNSEVAENIKDINF